jgi:protein O-mannosyl-transferase
MPEARVKAKARARPKAARKAPAKNRPRAGLYAAACAMALLVALQWAYGPALHGPFVFDDAALPYYLPNFPNALSAWIHGVRPLLMFTYWINYQLSKDPFSFHVFNVILHALNSILIFVIVRKLARTSDDLLPAFAAAVFLLHPIQTEAVSYIASRSEDLSVMFFLSALAVFLHGYDRPAGLSYGRALAVLALFAAAVATKEHTLVLPALLLLTDYYWNPGFSLSGVRRNWRLYVPLAVGGGVGLAWVAKVLAHAPSAGFGIQGLTWYQYFFTECRAFFVYLRLLVFPAGQNLDYDFPISHNLLEHGAIFGLAGLLLLAGAAIYFRRRYPLASYGFLAYLLLMAPTSSFVPIKDPVAERRMYLPMIGILLVLVAGLQRIRLDRRKLAAALAGVLVVLSILTYQRNQVWSSDITLWQDTVRKSPAKYRARFQLAHTYYNHQRYQDAVAQYAEAAKLQKPNYDLLVDWALACDDAGQPEEAIRKLRQAAALEPSAHVYSQIGMVYARSARWAEAQQALAEAARLNPNYPVTYYYRGGVRASTRDFAGAVADYQRALALGIDPALAPAVEQGLAYAQQQLRVTH